MDDDVIEIAFDDDGIINSMEDNRLVECNEMMMTMMDKNNILMINGTNNFIANMDEMRMMMTDDDE
jgi:ATP-dependent protease HslVU (ClpYQ) peptidase subunit